MKRRIKELDIQVAEDMSAQFKDGLTATVLGPDDSDKALRVNNDETVISVDADKSQTRSQLRVRPRHNEEGVQRVCSNFIEALNFQGGSWKKLTLQPLSSVSDIDCYATDDEGQKLNMQVTRATRNEELWKQIGQSGKASYEQGHDAAVEELHKAADDKQRYLPREQRKSLVLILDATDTPALAFSAVIASFRNKYGAWAKGLGFEGIWVVGPEKSFVHRLD